MKRFYITTTLPYVNAEPHIGFALEIIQADIVARAKRLEGFEVFFNTGTDEHGTKIYEKAIEEGKDPQVYTDEYATKFRELKETLNLSVTHFIRTTDAHHKEAAQEFWKKCEANGDIYKKLYKVKYCVGCELEKTDSELEEGRCPIHPNKEIQLIEEENYFFRFSEYQGRLLKLYEETPHFVLPEARLNEIKAFVGRGLQDFSISRLKSKMPWGVPVPNDPDHVMYVWFDALVNYISTLGWPNNEYKDWWPGVQVAGKDNLRQQTAMWQAMLMSAGVEPSKQVMIHGFITSGGQKMSKTLGNVINPKDIVALYGVDALRFYIASEISPFEDSDVTLEKFKDVYNGKLANGVGNFASRVLTMAENYGVSYKEGGSSWNGKNKVFGHIDIFEIDKAIKIIEERVQTLDKYIQENEPFKKIKTDKEGAEKDIAFLLQGLFEIGETLLPFIPETAEKIITHTKLSKKLETPLFPRK